MCECVKSRARWKMEWKGSRLVHDLEASNMTRI